GSTAACDVPLVRVAKTFAEWRADPVVTQEFLPQGEDPADQAPPFGEQEKQTYYNVHVNSYLENAQPGQSPVSSPAATYNVRCDVARQLNPQYVRGSDCVFFGLLATFKLHCTDPQYADYACLLRPAMTNHASSYHDEPPPQVPGNNEKPQP